VGQINDLIGTPSGFANDAAANTYVHDTFADVKQIGWKYYDSTLAILKTWDGTAWVATTPYGVATPSGSGYVLTLTSGVRIIEVTTGASDRTVDLPAVASFPTGTPVYIKKMDSGAGFVIVDPNAGETIDGGGTATLRAQYEAIVIINNGTQWAIHMAYQPVTQSDLTETAAIAAGAVLDHAAWTVQGTGGDARNFKSITFYITCTDKNAALSIQAEVLWSSTLAGTYGEQQAEGTPAAGVVIANDWRCDIDITGKAATFVVPWNVPVGGAFFKIQLRSATLHPIVGVSYMRQGA
jgi:hypothetical protein